MVTYRRSGTTYIIEGQKLYANGRPNVGCYVKLVYVGGDTDVLVATTTTNKFGYWKITIPWADAIAGPYTVQFWGSGTTPKPAPLGDWEEFDFFPSDFFLPTVFPGVLNPTLSKPFISISGIGDFMVTLEITTPSGVTASGISISGMATGVSYTPFVPIGAGIDNFYKSTIINISGVHSNLSLLDAPTLLTGVILARTGADTAVSQPFKLNVDTVQPQVSLSGVFPGFIQFNLGFVYARDDMTLNGVTTSGIITNLDAISGMDRIEIYRSITSSVADAKKVGRLNLSGTVDKQVKGTAGSIGVSYVDSLINSSGLISPTNQYWYWYQGYDAVNNPTLLSGLVSAGGPYSADLPQGIVLPSDLSDRFISMSGMGNYMVDVEITTQSGINISHLSTTFTNPNVYAKPYTTLFSGPFGNIYKTTVVNTASGVQFDTGVLGTPTYLTGTVTAVTPSIVASAPLKLKVDTIRPQATISGVHPGFNQTTIYFGYIRDDMTVSGVITSGVITDKNAFSGIDRLEVYRSTTSSTYDANVSLIGVVPMAGLVDKQIPGTGGHGYSFKDSLTSISGYISENDQYWYWYQVYDAMNNKADPANPIYIGGPYKPKFIEPADVNGLLRLKETADGTKRIFHYATAVNATKILYTNLTNAPLPVKLGSIEYEQGEHTITSNNYITVVNSGLYCDGFAYTFNDTKWIAPSGTIAFRLTDAAPDIINEAYKIRIGNNAATVSGISTNINTRIAAGDLYIKIPTRLAADEIDAGRIRVEDRISISNGLDHGVVLDNYGIYLFNTIFPDSTVMEFLNEPSATGDIAHIGKASDNLNAWAFRVTESGVTHLAEWQVKDHKLWSTGIDLVSYDSTVPTTNAHIAFGNTPPASSEIGTGIYADKTGFYGLVSDMQTFGVHSADGSVFLKSSTGNKAITINESANNELKFYNNGIAKVRIGTDVFVSGTPGIFVVDGILYSLAATTDKYSWATISDITATPTTANAFSVGVYANVLLHGGGYNGHYPAGIAVNAKIDGTTASSLVYGIQVKATGTTGVTTYGIYVDAEYGDTNNNWAFWSRAGDVWIEQDLYVGAGAFRVTAGGTITKISNIWYTWPTSFISGYAAAGDQLLKVSPSGDPDIPNTLTWVTFSGVTSSGMQGLTLGGTGADLHTSGPGFIQQETSGAPFSSFAWGANNTVLVGKGTTTTPTWDTTLTLSGTITGSKVYNSVYNDISDYFLDYTGDVEYGKVYVLIKNDVQLSSEYCQDGIVGVASNTFGFGVGIKKNAIPIAVAGIVLAFVDKTYSTGTPLTSTKNGWLTEMKQEEVIKYPTRLVAAYYRPEPLEIWHDIQVRGRHWVRIYH